MRFRSFAFSILFMAFSALQAQPAEKRMSLDGYVDKWQDAAVSQMHKHGIPASITLAQGILESGYGNSPLARYANNHFGIKCHGWEGEKFYKDDDRADECFRKYYDAARSYKDHSAFLTQRGRYSFLFDLRITDYKGWAKGLKKAGYATDPNYPKRLIELIEKHELHRFDTVPSMQEKEPEVAEEDRRRVEEEKDAKGEPLRHPNGIDLVRVGEGESFSSIAETFDLSEARLLRYNDMNPTDRLSPGDTLYLQPKRNWSRKQKIHVAEEGDLMWDIAQRYGLKLEKLYERNHMIPGTEPEPGQKIYLRGKAPERGADGEEKKGFFARLFGKGD